MRAFQPVAQEDYNGCSVSCVASLLGISYKKSLKLFGRYYSKEKGAYCRDIVKVLEKKKLNYKYSKVVNKTKRYVNEFGSIVFIRRSKEYPIGHYLLKTRNGWMNSWINLSMITPLKIPVKAGFQKRLPGKAQWIIYPNNNL
ncbi:MAG: hypothetical protein KGH55_00700 [Nanoarchaeota archaeon]|nr:hypothetical protein [Nanoarchaeota archaeon]